MPPEAAPTQAATTTTTTPPPAQPAVADPKPAEPAKPGATAEPPKEPETPAPKKEEELGPRFAALARKEQKVTAREQAVKAQEKDVAAWKKAKEDARLNPKALLEAHGLSYEDVTQFVLNDGKLTDAQRLALVEEQLKREEAKKQEDAAKAKKENEQKIIDDHKSAIREFVEQGGDDFELIRAHEAHDLVHDVVQQHFDLHGTILPIPEAAKAVEEHLEKEAREKVLKLKRFQPKPEVKTDADSKAPSATGAQPETTRPATTLTNSATTSTPSADRKDLSDEESLARAAGMLRWT